MKFLFYPEKSWPPTSGGENLILAKSHYAWNFLSRSKVSCMLSLLVHIWPPFCVFVCRVTFDGEQKVTKTFDHGWGRDPMTQVWSILWALTDCCWEKSIGNPSVIADPKSKDSTLMIKLRFDPIIYQMKIKICKLTLCNALLPWKIHFMSSLSGLIPKEPFKVYHFYTKSKFN